MISAARPARRLNLTRSLAALTSALMVGACSQTAELLPSANFLSDTEQVADSDVGVAGESDLQKATIYWGRQYAKRPSDVNNGLNYARNLKAMGEKQKALTVLQETSSIHNGNTELAGEYGRLALELDQVNVAEKLLAIADNPTKPDWRIVSARGTVLAKQGKYKESVAFYERALQLSNNQSSVLNNLAMAHAMNGEPAKAEALLRQATAETGAAPKVSQNLALVLGLQGRYDEAKTYAVTASGAEAVKSDTDLLRTLVKAPAQPMSPAAIPAFATHTSPTSSRAAVAKVTATAQPETLPPIIQPQPMALRPPLVDTVSSRSTTPLIAKTADTSGVGLRGSSR